MRAALTRNAGPHPPTVRTREITRNAFATDARENLKYYR